MGFLELLLIAIGLSMDAFAVSICKGLTIRHPSPKKWLMVGVYFGVFQAVMPLIGYTIGSQFESQIKSVDHWIAFALLFVIGINMIIGSFKKDDEEEQLSTEDFSPKSMVPLALATSIDALAVGVTLAFLSTDILPAIILIGVTTFTLSCVGVNIGHKVGSKFKAKAEFLGGAVLILLGTKILLEHLNILVF